MGVRVIPLGSGSRGNATLVEFGSTRILVDAGLSARDLGRRLDGLGVAADSVDAIVLTHEHHDHARGAERFSMLHRVPVACAAATLDAMNLAPMHLAKWWKLAPGDRLEIGEAGVETFPVPHDAADPVGFVLDGEGVRVGVATDLGHATTVVQERLRGCHVLLIESNHDETMLRDGPYPWQLKQRVGSRLGHLSNRATAALLREIADDQCRAVVLMHLSEKNNTQALARETAGRALAEAGRNRVQMRVAMQRRPTAAVEL